MRLKLFPALVCVVTVLQFPMLAAEEKDIPAPKGSSSSPSAVALAGQALRLAAYARENESPVAMLAAIEMLGRIRFHSGEQRLGQKTTEGKAQAPATKGTAAPPTTDLDSLAAEAKAWAKADPILIAFIERKLAEAKKARGGTLGADGGPIEQLDCVLGGQTDTWTIRFNANQRAEVAVSGDGRTDLDLVVEDEQGTVVFSDLDRGDQCQAGWMPKKTGIFRIRIANIEAAPNAYRLVVN